MKSFNQFLTESPLPKKMTQKRVHELMKSAGHSRARWWRGGGDPGYDHKVSRDEHGKVTAHHVAYASYSKEHSHEAIADISKHLETHGVKHSVGDHGKGYMDYREPGKEKTERRITIPVNQA